MIVPTVSSEIRICLLRVVISNRVLLPSPLKTQTNTSIISNNQGNNNRWTKLPLGAGAAAAAVVGDEDEGDAVEDMDLEGRSILGAAVGLPLFSVEFPADAVVTELATCFPCSESIDDLIFSLLAGADSVFLGRLVSGEVLLFLIVI
jgi:hypothetical protein